MIDKKKLAGAILAGVLTVAGATSAFAADVSNDTKAAVEKQFIKIDKTEIYSKVKAALDKLVSAGTITQAQADAALKEFTPGEGKGPFHMIRGSFLGKHVADGTITQAQADAINAALKTAREKGTGIEAVLKELVSAGTITQAQADSINAAIKTGMEADKSIEDILKALVTDGTITEAQKEALLKLFPLRGESFMGKSFIEKDAIKNGGMHKGGFIKFSSSPLDELVSAGKLTQAQADAVLDAVKSALKPLEKQ